MKELRLDAGITGVELASQCGWHKSKSSRIENARTPPSDADIRAWCRACNASDQADDLIAASRSAESLYVEWRRKQRAGLRHLQESYIPLYEQTKVFRNYTPNLIPGFLQTPEYAAALFRSITEFDEIDDDVEEATKARIDRSRILWRGNRRLAMVLEESVLRHRIGDSETMAGQLGHLLTVMPLPHVSIGIIPFTSPRPIWPMEAYVIFDDYLVQIELAAAELSIEAPTEVSTYLKTFDRFQKIAAYGTEARALITSAIEALE
ncbi:helix-turn-helix transcriptional regulator [Nocardiopsis sp. NPDC049922]|uniref:helix-turn-helix domain-containing protein n=1 Tax=Nocardiopsis sp. NPDC049922 TaxID=3155157 RepID=UPI0033D39E24